MVNSQILANKFMRSQRNIMIGIATVLIFLLCVSAYMGHSYVAKEAVANRIFNSYNRFMNSDSQEPLPDADYRENTAAYLSSEASGVPVANGDGVVRL